MAPSNFEREGKKIAAAIAAGQRSPTYVHSEEIVRKENAMTIAIRTVKLII
jgi:hypothetical protein